MLTAPKRISVLNNNGIAKQVLLEVEGQRFISEDDRLCAAILLTKEKCEELYGIAIEEILRVYCNEKGIK